MAALPNHRMAWVEKDHNHLVSTPCYCRVAKHQTGLPRATSSLALNESRDGASNMWGKLEWRTSVGLFSYSMKVYVRNKAGGDDSHVIDNIHNKFNSPCIYYLPASPALSLLIHFYQESFSHANEAL